MKENKMNKYDLKGDYYQLFEKIDMNIKGIVSNGYRKKVLNKLLDLFLRMQGSRKSPEEAMGKSYQEFVEEIITSYYETITPKEKFLRIISNMMLYSLFCMITFIIFVGSAEYRYSSGLIVCSLVGIVWGLLVFIIQKSVLKKLRDVMRTLMQAAMLFIPIYLISLLASNIIQFSNSFYIHENIIKGIFVLEIIIYIVVSIINFYDEKANRNDKKNNTRRC